ncbi:MAG: DNA-protecting protein DprA [Bacilli bacterium]|nr:DNA-protecting protein DprA [Bacilli bacterium]
MVTAREILLTLSFKYKGDWMKIYEAIKKKEPIKDEEKKEAIDKTKANFVTLVDPDYPEFLKTISQPPFLFYYYGDKSLLLEKYRLTVVGTRHPSLYQTEKVYSLIAEAEKRLNNKIVVVSGMAIGVDASACGRHLPAAESTSGFWDRASTIPILRRMKISISWPNRGKASSSANIPLPKKRSPRTSFSVTGFWRRLATC